MGMNTTLLINNNIRHLSFILKYNSFHWKNALFCEKVTKRILLRSARKGEISWMIYAQKQKGKLKMVN